MGIAPRPIHPVATPVALSVTEPGNHRFGRSLHLIDIENLCRTGRPTEAQVADVASRYRQAVGLTATDLSLVGIGTDPLSRFAVTSAWPGGRVHCQPGPDGADLALLMALADEPDVASRFDRLVIGSGDNAFSGVARYNRMAGVSVTVVGNLGSVAAVLAREADRVVFLPEPDRVLG